MTKDSSPRYAAALDVARPRGSRLLEAFSLKVNRRVRLFDHARFDQWVRLEADPQVLSLCERPARIGPAPDARLIDFWVRRRDGEQLLLMRHRPAQPLLRSHIHFAAGRQSHFYFAHPANPCSMRLCALPSCLGKGRVSLLPSRLDHLYFSLRQGRSLL